jgi:hypothetical protein
LLELILFFFSFLCSNKTRVSRTKKDLFNSYSSLAGCHRVTEQRYEAEDDAKATQLEKSKQSKRREEPHQKRVRDSRVDASLTAA